MGRQVELRRVGQGRDMRERQFTYLGCQGLEVPKRRSPHYQMLSVVGSYWRGRSRAINHAMGILLGGWTLQRAVRQLGPGWIKDQTEQQRRSWRKMQ